VSVAAGTGEQRQQELAGAPPRVLEHVGRPGVVQDAKRAGPPAAKPTRERVGTGVAELARDLASVGRGRLAALHRGFAGYWPFVLILAIDAVLNVAVRVVRARRRGLPDGQDRRGR
jgi:hypothetical protein